MVEKAMEDNIVLFQNDALIVRSILVVQTIFQKIKWFQANDSSNIKAIVAYLLEKSKVEQGTPRCVLDYLKDNLNKDWKGVQAKENLFTQ